MSKATTIQARIQPELKEMGDAILKKIGITASQAINALYAQIVMRKGLPFELKIPNEATQAAMRELEQGGGKSFSSFKAMIDDLDNDDA
ncbi:MAG: damage-inducible protein J [Legionellales bacterium RIFCSPHIGHO2_12_FULL_37_14]|nr:MAG: damage-inducible protein J [Legionellales bacterium RIFCSPHIGHO2_12_FULL_37_14]